MATYTKEILKEGSGPGIRVGQKVTVEVCLKEFVAHVPRARPKPRLNSYANR